MFMVLGTLSIGKYISIHGDYEKSPGEMLVFPLGITLLIIQTINSRPALITALRDSLSLMKSANFGL